MNYFRRELIGKLMISVALFYFPEKLSSLKTIDEALKEQKLIMVMAIFIKELQKSKNTMGKN